MIGLCDIDYWLIFDPRLGKNMSLRSQVFTVSTCTWSCVCAWVTDLCQAPGQCWLMMSCVRVHRQLCQHYTCAEIRYTWWSNSGIVDPSMFSRHPGTRFWLSHIFNGTKSPHFVFWIGNHCRLDNIFCKKLCERIHAFTTILEEHAYFSDVCAKVKIDVVWVTSLSIIIYIVLLDIGKFPSLSLLSFRG